MESGNGISQCMLAMTDFKLIGQWNNSIEAWFMYQHNIIFVPERCIHSQERVLYREFSRKALKARMLRDVAKRNSVLWKMGGMKPDCDISLKDGLQYACSASGDLKSFKIVDYKKVGQKDVVTIKHMLLAFPLLCDVMSTILKDSRFSTGRTLLSRCHSSSSGMPNFIAYRKPSSKEIS
ncbi:hypothetical protein DVH24_041975 [Malus domestica]|uniref:Uncharacterized protein n=1 Tax=Malus domestica TaxID=3750 RepID=A0A498ISW8_MALDO|nr:hypothetical protein DVH24_041975 [Malus domestica]